MASISEVGSRAPVSSSVSGGHGDHGAGATTPAASGQVFASVLAQKIGQSANNGVSASTASHMGGRDQRGAHGVQETALGLRAFRQQVIASNIANADTPGYKAVDIDFQEALRMAQAAANIAPLSLTVTRSGHIPAGALPNVPPFPLKYHTPSQASADGNTVEMDVERAKVAENAVMYEFSLDRASGHFKMMMELFQTLKD